MAMYRVEAPHYVAGFEEHEGVITESAPILRWSIGKPLSQTLAYFKRKGFNVTKLWS